MSLLKKILLILLLVVPLSVAGFLYWRVISGADGAMRQVAEIVSPYAAMRYGGVSVDWNGAITIDRVEIQPAGSSAVFPIKSVVIGTPGLRYLMARAGGHLSTSGRPDVLTIQATDLTLDLTGEAGKFLDQLASLTARPEADAISHCGDHKQIGMSEWREMGINRLHANASLTYSMDRSRDSATLEATAKIKDLLALKLDSTMTQVQASSDTMPWLRGHIHGFKVTYKDDGYLETLKRYCAAAAKTEPAAYLDAEAGGTGSIFLQQLSLAVAPTLRTAYREFLGQPDTVALDVAVPPDLKIENFGIYNKADLADSLTFTVSFNGKRADDMQYGFRPPRDGPSQAVLSAKAAVEAMNKPRVKTRKGDGPGIIDAPKYVFQEVPKAQLPKHLGKRVRFHVNRSSMREGLLTSIDGGTAHIQSTRGENEVSVAIMLRHVERVEVAK